jgi:hypothetical protein
MAETVYNVYKKLLADGDEDWPNADYRAALLTGSVTIDPDHATVAAVIAANTEASDGSYARQALGTQTNTQDDANDRANLDAATIDFGALDATTPTAMLIFRQVTTDSDSIPVAIYDTNFGAAANGAGYTVTTPNDLLRIS